jgi:hypothetical protein
MDGLVVGGYLYAMLMYINLITNEISFFSFIDSYAMYVLIATFFLLKKARKGILREKKGSVFNAMYLLFKYFSL